MFTARLPFADYSCSYNTVYLVFTKQDNAHMITDHILLIILTSARFFSHTSSLGLTSLICRNRFNRGRTLYLYSLRSWRDFACECFCFGSEAVNTSGEAVRGLVKFTRRFAAREFPCGSAARSLARSRTPPATQTTTYRGHLPNKNLQNLRTIKTLVYLQDTKPKKDSKTSLFTSYNSFTKTEALV